MIEIRELVMRLSVGGRAVTILDGVAGDPSLNQADGIHPNAAGHRVVALHVWPYLQPLLRR